MQSQRQWQIICLLLYCIISFVLLYFGLPKARCLMGLSDRKSVGASSQRKGAAPQQGTQSVGKNSPMSLCVVLYIRTQRLRLFQDTCVGSELFTHVYCRFFSHGNAALAPNTGRSGRHSVALTHIYGPEISIASAMFKSHSQ